MSTLRHLLRASAPPRRLDHWATATATTVDGVEARLSADFTAVVEDHDEDLARVVELVEDALRRLVAASTVVGAGPAYRALSRRWSPT